MACISAADLTLGTAPHFSTATTTTAAIQGLRGPTDMIAELTGVITCRGMDRRRITRLERVPVPSADTTMAAMRGITLLAARAAPEGGSMAGDLVAAVSMVVAAVSMAAAVVFTAEAAAGAGKRRWRCAPGFCCERG